MTALRQYLRRLLPAGVRTPLRRSETYVKRLAVWRGIARHVEGVREVDRAALRRSMFRSPLTAARSLGKWCDPVLLENAQVDVKGVGRFDVRAHSDDLWHVLPTREPAIYEAICSALRPGDVFVDAGANIGFYTVLASKLVGSSGRVIAIEMMPDTTAVLRRHVKLNALLNVELVERALSDREGDVVCAHVTEGKFGQATISAAAGGTAVEVLTTTLDIALKDVPSVRLMKMDIEGLEELALRGAEQVLGKVQALIFECWAEETEVAHFLSSRGFAVRPLDGRNRIAVRL